MRGVNPPLMINRRAGVFFVVSDVLGGSSANSSDSAGVDGHTSVKRSDVSKILKIRPVYAKTTYRMSGLDISCRKPEISGVKSQLPVRLTASRIFFPV